MSSIAFAGPAFGSTTHAPAPRLRLTSRGRGVVGTLVVLPLVAVALFFGFGAHEAVATDTAVTSSFTYVVVEPGQSLWQVAEQLAPTADPRVVVDDLVLLNGLASADVQAGQKLAIPTAYAG